MILVSPHTKILTLEINSSKPAASKAQSLFRRSYRDQRRDIMLFKLIKNSYPGPSHFSPKNISINDPFRVPTKIRERHKKKYTDFNFQDLVDRKIESKMLGVRCTPDPAGELRKINFEQVHYVRKLKAKMIWKSRPISGKGDAALLISRKKINPMVHYRNQS